MSIGQHFASCPLLTSCQARCSANCADSGWVQGRTDRGEKEGQEEGKSAKSGWLVGKEEGDKKPRLVRAGIWLVSSAVIWRRGGDTQLVCRHPHSTFFTLLLIAPLQTPAEYKRHVKDDHWVSDIGYRKEQLPDIRNLGRRWCLKINGLLALGPHHG